MGSAATGNRARARVLLNVLALFIVLGGVYSGYLFFTTVRAYVAHTDLPSATRPIAQLPTSPEHPVPGGQELPDITADAGRINVLLLGIDKREHETGAFRTDTMILVSIDTTNHTAAMLSIPRDLWVAIPGYGENRINTANFFGDAYGYPGGGMALAKRTVQQTLGVPVHAAVRLSFTGFERLIDAIGGITIDVAETIYDDRYPDGSYGYMTVHIPAGVQPMDGVVALQYARVRHGSSDFGRMERQQQVLLAVRNKVLALDFPISRIPSMLDLVGDSVETDLTLPQIVYLATVAKGVQLNGIRHGIIDQSMTTTVTTPQGWMVEVPDRAKVRQLVDDLFPPSDLQVSAPNLDRAQLLSEGARIELHNGTLSIDLASTLAERLREAGFNVIRYQNADRFDYDRTILVDRGDHPYSIETLAQHLEVRPEQIQRVPGGDDGADIVVIVGRDLAERIAR
jgi:polyisoprenyl-teichoic acid--peptidoglycan teichoic acid transferase